jgi:hypothetical protein
MHEPTIDILRQWHSSGMLQPLIDQFNSVGIVSDEDGLGISSSMAEGWNRSCDSFIASHGYRGGPIKLHAEYFSNSGNIYALYDSETISDGEVRAYVQAAANRNPPL